MDSNTRIRKRASYLEFKSCSTVTDSRNILRYLTRLHLGCNQRLWIHKTPTIELSEWCSDDLQKVRISVKNIDRLYHLDLSDLHMEMIARMRYRDQLLYIKVLVNKEFCCVRCCGRGIIHVGKDVNTFMRQVLWSKRYLRNAICELLAEDDIALDIDDLLAVDKEIRDGYCLQRYCNTVPTLEYFCKKSMYRERMQPDRLGLPRIIEKDYTDFINFEDIEEIKKEESDIFLLNSHCKLIPEDIWYGCCECKSCIYS